jgi:hypothetical protein
MKSKHLVLASLLYFTLFCGLARCAEPPSNQVWVAIRVVDKGVGQAPTEYYGTMERKVFVGMLNTTVPSGFLELEHVAVMLNGRLTPMSEEAENGAKYGYGDVAYFRVETVLRIVLLSDEFPKEHSLKSN